MLYAFDTEFIDDGITIELISLGVVREDEIDFYAQNRNASLHLASPWVLEHIFPGLSHMTENECKPPSTKWGRQVSHCKRPECPWLYHDEIRDAVLGFLADDPHPQFLGYYSAYDWVVLCQLFGSMVDIPASWPKHARDLRTLLNVNGHHDVKQSDDDPHHALTDAQWIMRTYKQYCKGMTI